MSSLLKTIKEAKGFCTAEGRFFNFKEIHALVNGFYFGFNPFYERIPPEKISKNKDMSAEPHYARGAFVAGKIGYHVGDIIKTGLLFYLGSKVAFV